MHFRRRCAAAAASLALCLLFGLRAAPQSSDDDIRASLKKFTDVYRTIEANFADKVDPDQVLYHGAIPTMLRTLDPHSTFWDPKAYESLREEQVGCVTGSELGRLELIEGHDVRRVASADRDFRIGALEVRDQDIEGGLIPAESEQGD